jgi:predicted HAD superfamily Cof-like phosphohydrolase
MSLEIAKADVFAFMLAVDQSMPVKPVGPADVTSVGEMSDLYMDLMAEEYQEFKDSETFPEAVDGAIDLIWVTLGWLNAVGVNASPIWEAVRLANMTKVSGPVCPDTGKRIKPPGFKHPDIAALIDQQRK